MLRRIQRLPRQQIRKDTISYFNECKTTVLKVLKTDVRDPSAGTAGCAALCGLDDSRTNAWRELLFSGSTKALRIKRMV
jgi:hypothetical protein